MKLKHITKHITIAIITSITLFGGAANAALMTTPVQTQEYVGKAGNKSGLFGVAPFSFAKFNPSLGTLLRVVSKLQFTISGGLISADNLTNKVATGNGTLGGSATVSSTVPFLTSTFTPMFTGFNLTQSASFTLAADPAMTTGGNGPDVYTLYGGSFSKDSGWQTLADPFEYAFVGTGNVVVDFDTSSTVIINAIGARGSFEAVDTKLTMQTYYEYDGIPTPPPAPVSVGFSFGALLLAGLGLACKKKLTK